MKHPKLKQAAFLYEPEEGKEPAVRELPADYAADPFKYLPDPVILSPEELRLADNYLRGDFSGGYMTSQIACFRRRRSPEEHQRRREKFAGLKAEVARRGYPLPPPLLTLMENDDYCDRLRHNTIGLTLPDQLVPFPSHPDHLLFLLASEGQGCRYWHLLLAPDGWNIVTGTDEPFGGYHGYPDGRVPDPADSEFVQAADGFDAWIVNYFLECRQEDRGYDQMLAKYPGM